MLSEAQFASSFLLTRSESKILTLLVQNINQICSRDQIAQSLWNNAWLDKYSDWEIDAQIYHLRKKLASKWQIKTVRNRGYALLNKSKKINITNRHLAPLNQVPQLLPPIDYLHYMNDPNQIRKTLFDLLKVYPLIRTGLNKDILIIDSYSTDNIEAISQVPARNIYFSHFDDRSLQMHYQKIIEFGKDNIFMIYDDIRKSRLKPDYFDIIINDFRLNFNLNHKQNILSLQNMHKLLKSGGQAIVSVVVDARYESPRFGKNQELAPLNIYSPWSFEATENLKRNCYTVPYYKKLIFDCGFQVISEFDMEEGKNWARQFTTEKTFHSPHYRRYLLQKKI